MDSHDYSLIDKQSSADCDENDKEAVVIKDKRMANPTVRSTHSLSCKYSDNTKYEETKRHLKKNARHKHMLLLLNKCDLVPAWVTKR